MLVSIHTLTGSAIGASFSNAQSGALWAFILGWLSHYLLDAIPHWERLYRKGEGQSEFKTDMPIKKWPKSFIIQAFLDAFLAIALTILLVNIGKSGLLFWQSTVFWGIIGALLPDLLDNVPFWNRYLAKLRIFHLLSRVHDSFHIKENRQKHLPEYLGLFTQIFLAVIAVAIILWQLSLGV